MPDITDLKSSISRRHGFAHQNRFFVHVTPPRTVLLSKQYDTRDFNILCENCTLPGRQITTLEYQLLRQPIKVPNGYINEEVVFSFLLTNDFYIKKIFDLWSTAVINFDNYRANYLEDYKGTIQIYQLDKLENKIYGVELVNAFPTSLNGIPLDNNSENTVQRFAVSIAYEDFFVLPLSEINLKDSVKLSELEKESLKQILSEKKISVASENATRFLDNGLAVDRPIS